MVILQLQMSLMRCSIRSEFRSYKLSSDRQEQWSRRNCIRIRGMKEHEGENTIGLVHTVCCDIGVQLRPGDISTSHRTGRRRPDHPRDIIVLFTHRETKYRVMRGRSKLRNIERARGVYIDEDLTVIRARVVKELRREGWFVQTHDGKINAKKEGQQPLWIDYPQEFTRLPWTEEKFRQLGITPDF